MVHFFLIMIGISVLSLIYFLVAKAFVDTPGIILNKKFVKLGVLKGKTYAEIKNAVGSENSISKEVLDDGSVITIRQWFAPGYHIVLLFDENEICLGVSNEIKV